MCTGDQGIDVEPLPEDGEPPASSGTLGAGLGDASHASESYELGVRFEDVDGDQDAKLKYGDDSEDGSRSSECMSDAFGKFDGDDQRRSSQQSGSNTDSNRHTTGTEAVQQFIKSRQRTQLVEKVWRILDDPESNKAALLWERCALILILFAIASALIQTLDYPQFKAPTTVVVLVSIEIAVEAWFLGEILIRFATCPGRRKFFDNPYNVIDLLSGLPVGFRVALFCLTAEWPAHFVLSRIVTGTAPAIRLLKVLRRFNQIHLLSKAFGQALEALPVMMFTYLCLLFSFSAMLYIVEREDNIETFSQAMWLAIVSMTTLGYGDKTPRTSLGDVLVGVFVFTSVLYTAIPLGIIGNAFNMVWQDRDRILLMQRTRSRLEQAGYDPKDIPTLFKLFDTDHNGQLDMQEFKWMLNGMKLGLKKDRVNQLYSCFDGDNSGGIDADEFLKTLFPNHYDIMKKTPSGLPGARDSLTMAEAERQQGRYSEMPDPTGLSGPQWSSEESFGHFNLKSRVTARDPTSVDELEKFRSSMKMK